MRKTETGGKIAAPAFAFFFKEYLALHPEIPRTFTKPSKVFVSTINGKTEYYTPKSPLPEIEIEIVPEDPNEEVMEF
jgi:penicillin-binding protein 1A